MNSFNHEGGDEKCEMNSSQSSDEGNISSPAPGETKGASLCKCGHEVGLHFYHSHGGGKTACCDPDCKCDKYESPEQPSSPAWIPVSDKKPEEGRAFWALYADNSVSFFETYHKLCEYSFVSWMYPQGIYQVPPPPAPKSQKEKDEEAYQKLDKKGILTGLGLWRAALAYARGEKVKE